MTLAASCFRPSDKHKFVNQGELTNKTTGARRLIRTEISVNIDVDKIAFLKVDYTCSRGNFN